ncbi:MAG: dihydroorotase [Flavobacteriales bacterium]|jgi:dihydroorotase
MKTLIKSALIIDPTSTHNGKKRDILIDKGIIIKIAASISDTKADIISGKNLCVSPGWIDLRANFRDPGDEHKEDLHSGLDAAEAGGFRFVVTMPSTNPVIDSKSQIEYITSRNAHHTVEVLPAGALSAKMEGKVLAEMYDMQQAGAVAFCDDKQNVSTEMMVRALEYAKNFHGLIMSFPYDGGVNPGGLINEGPSSVNTGMKGLSNTSEELRLMRDIELLRYTGGKLHVSLISTAQSVEFIRKAKKEKLNITCAIAAHQLAFLDSDLEAFDSNLKVLPPFRNAVDRKALIKGLKDGTIDAICSDHQPEDHEHKVLEFEYANFGISSIQTAFSVALTHLGDSIELPVLIEKFTTGPAKVLGMGISSIEEEYQAELTVFETETERTFGKKEWRSKSINSPFFDKTLKGNVIAVI